MKKVEKVDSLFEFLRVFLGIVIAFLICVVIISIMSKSNAGEAVKNFMVGPFMSTRRFGQVMAPTRPFRSPAGLLEIDGLMIRIPAEDIIQAQRCIFKIRFEIPGSETRRDGHGRRQREQ